ncbi:MAG: hypothetical protein ACI92I_000750 [Acidimicrobiales bacterium]|jgi:hypothetical protein
MFELFKKEIPQAPPDSGREGGRLSSTQRRAEKNKRLQRQTARTVPDDLTEVPKREYNTNATKPQGAPSMNGAGKGNGTIKDFSALGKGLQKREIPQAPSGETIIPPPEVPELTLVHKIPVKSAAPSVEITPPVTNGEDIKGFPNNKAEEQALDAAVDKKLMSDDFGEGNEAVKRAIADHSVAIKGDVTVGDNFSGQIVGHGNSIGGNIEMNRTAGASEIVGRSVDSTEIEKETEIEVEESDTQEVEFNLSEEIEGILNHLKYKDSALLVKENGQYRQLTAVHKEIHEILKTQGYKKENLDKLFKKAINPVIDNLSGVFDTLVEKTVNEDTHNLDTLTAEVHKQSEWLATVVSNFASQNEARSEIKNPDEQTQEEIDTAQATPTDSLNKKHRRMIEEAEENRLTDADYLEIEEEAREEGYKKRERIVSPDSPRNSPTETEDVPDDERFHTSKGSSPDIVDAEVFDGLSDSLDVEITSVEIDQAEVSEDEHLEEVSLTPNTDITLKWLDKLIKTTKKRRESVEGLSHADLYKTSESYKNARLEIQKLRALLTLRKEGSDVDEVEIQMVKESLKKNLSEFRLEIKSRDPEGEITGPEVYTKMQDEIEGFKERMFTLLEANTSLQNEPEYTTYVASLKKVAPLMEGLETMYEQYSTVRSSLDSIGRQLTALEQKREASESEEKPVQKNSQTEQPPVNIEQKEIQKSEYLANIDALRAAVDERYEQIEPRAQELGKELQELFTQAKQILEVDGVSSDKFRVILHTYAQKYEKFITDTDGFSLSLEEKKKNALEKLDKQRDQLYSDIDSDPSLSDTQKKEEKKKVEDQRNMAINILANEDTTLEKVFESMYEWGDMKDSLAVNTEKISGTSEQEPSNVMLHGMRLPKEGPDGKYSIPSFAGALRIWWSSIKDNEKYRELVTKQNEVFELLKYDRAGGTFPFGFPENGLNKKDIEKLTVLAIEINEIEEKVKSDTATTPENASEEVETQEDSAGATQENSVETDSDDSAAVGVEEPISEPAIGTQKQPDLNEAADKLKKELSVMNMADIELKARALRAEYINEKLSSLVSLFKKKPPEELGTLGDGVIQNTIARIESASSESSVVQEVSEAGPKMYTVQESDSIFDYEENTDDKELSPALEKVPANKRAEVLKLVHTELLDNEKWKKLVGITGNNPDVVKSGDIINVTQLDLLIAEIAKKHKII